MEKEELIERLNGYEWNDIEFKKAQRGVPESAYETVSAFSNTAGGWLVLGIRDGAGGIEMVGVLEVDKVQNEFLSVLHAGQKLNHVIAVKEQLVEDEGKALLIFHVPEARRQEKPIYLNGDIRRSFIRRGGCDERCTRAEIEGLLRDATDERYDAETINLDPEHCFDDESVRWYRKLFYDRNPGHDEALSPLEFLHHWGLVLEAGGKLLPTRAALLLFGTESVIRQVLSRPVVDWQWIRTDWSDRPKEQRWADRVVVEVNLVKAWKALVDRYLQHAERPFSVDPGTLQRDDLPLDYIAFREATINLLIHQDYADHGRKPVIQFFNDRTLFWNPGDAFASAEELLEPGEKEVRNPRIVSAFRRIGLSEQAGTGVRSIFSNWQQLGHVPPLIQNDKTRKAFELILLKERLLSEEQLLFQSGLGVHLNEAEAKAFALACREGRLRPRDVRVVTGLSGSEVQAVVDRLAVQALITPLKGSESPIFLVSEHLRERLEAPPAVGKEAVVPPQGLATDQAGTQRPGLVSDQPRPLRGLTDAQATILMFCDVPRSMAEVMRELGMTHRTFFRRTHLEPLLRGGLLRMTHPAQPNHPDQAYVLTETGVELKARRLNCASERKKD